MLISKRSQLGLRFEDMAVKVLFLKAMENNASTKVDTLNKEITFLQALPKNEDGKVLLSEDELNDYKEWMGKDFTIPLQDDLEMIETSKSIDRAVDRTITQNTGVKIQANWLQSIIRENDSSKYFLILDSVYKAAELVKIGGGFTSRTMKDINLGHYTYLLGKNKMVRFVVVVGAIKGFYFDDHLNIAFEFGLDIESGKHYVDGQYNGIFSNIMQILTFVELGDIEVITLDRGRNNGGKKKVDKVTNGSNNTVYVVDSSWNKLIIRTDGFAVRGHFRLQPCGHAHADRKLIWVDAFEKHGYTRRPRAEIIR